jgi:hypothetical protein
MAFKSRICDGLFACSFEVPVVFGVPGVDFYMLYGTINIKVFDAERVPDAAPFCRKMFVFLV